MDFIIDVFGIFFTIVSIPELWFRRLFGFGHISGSIFISKVFIAVSSIPFAIGSGVHISHSFFDFLIYLIINGIVTGVTLHYLFSIGQDILLTFPDVCPKSVRVVIEHKELVKEPITDDSLERLKKLFRTEYSNVRYSYDRVYLYRYENVLVSLFCICMFVLSLLQYTLTSYPIDPYSTVVCATCLFFILSASGHRFAGNCLVLDYYKYRGGLQPQYHSLKTVKEYEKAVIDVMKDKKVKMRDSRCMIIPNVMNLNCIHDGEEKSFVYNAIIFERIVNRYIKDINGWLPIKHKSKFWYILSSVFIHSCPAIFGSVIYYGLFTE